MSERIQSFCVQTFVVGLLFWAIFVMWSLPSPSQTQANIQRFILDTPVTSVKMLAQAR